MRPILHSRIVFLVLIHSMVFAHRPSLVYNMYGPYENTDILLSTHFLSQNVVFQIADDLNVPQGEEWTINAVTILGEYAVNFPALYDVLDRIVTWTIELYDSTDTALNGGGLPRNLIFTYTGPILNSSTYIVVNKTLQVPIPLFEPEDVTLASGRYFVSIYPTINNTGYTVPQSLKFGWFSTLVNSSLLQQFPTLGSKLGRSVVFRDKNNFFGNGAGWGVVPNGMINNGYTDPNFKDVGLSIHADIHMADSSPPVLTMFNVSGPDSWYFASMSMSVTDDLSGFSKGLVTLQAPPGGQPSNISVEWNSGQIYLKSGNLTNGNYLIVLNTNDPSRCYSNNNYDDNFNCSWPVVGVEMTDWEGNIVKYSAQNLTKLLGFNQPLLHRCVGHRPINASLPVCNTTLIYTTTDSGTILSASSTTVTTAEGVSSPDSGGNTIPLPLIIGVVVGVVALALLIGSIVFVVRRRKKRGSAEDRMQEVSRQSNWGAN